ncbi:MAG: sulfotransferase domain-containing protein, partial [Actinomycetota bacterium]|nr:sulfotransferase domain-containing protein [Actinomycetota bacterium]
MPTTPFRYRSADEDSALWADFPMRRGDIVISTRSKHGTTWMQMICALLVFQTQDPPAPLFELSPWLDWLAEPHQEVLARLAAQRHRRFVKTHTPLDGIPIDSEVTYIVVARHPLDAAVSMYHHGDNLDRGFIRGLIGSEPGDGDPSPPRPPVVEWLRTWVERDADWRADLDSLPGVMGHLRDAWGRREEPNVVLVHFDDLRHDLDSEMRRLAGRLRIDVPEDRWPDLVAAASFSRMRATADQVTPGPAGVLKDRTAFFRSGGSGEGARLLDAEGLARYHQRTAN